MAVPTTDTDELARFGYKQELDRSLGLFSSFAAGFSYISIIGFIGIAYYLAKLRGRPAAVLAEHRADLSPAAVGVADEPAGP